MGFNWVFKGLKIGPIHSPETSEQTKLRRVTSEKNEDLNKPAAKG